MSDIDLNKLKVAELRDELSSRGLDTKGVKTALVKRLRTALNKEAKEKKSSVLLSPPSTTDEDQTLQEEQKDESFQDEGDDGEELSEEKSMTEEEDEESKLVAECAATGSDTSDADVPIENQETVTSDNAADTRNGESHSEGDQHNEFEKQDEQFDSSVGKEADCNSSMTEAPLETSTVDEDALIKKHETSVEPMLTKQVTIASTPVEPSTSTSVDSTPAEPMPVEPMPVEPVPVEPVPAEPMPVEPIPMEPTPVEPIPMEPTPVEPIPLEPTPVEPIPMESTVEPTLKESMNVEAQMESMPAEPVLTDSMPIEAVSTLEKTSKTPFTYSTEHSDPSESFKVPSNKAKEGNHQPNDDEDQMSNAIAEGTSDPQSQDHSFPVSTDMPMEEGRSLEKDSDMETNETTIFTTTEQLESTESLPSGVPDSIAATSEVPVNEGAAECDSENADKGLKRKRVEETNFSVDEDVKTVPVKKERAGRERRTRWDTMKVEKEEFDDNAVTLDTYNSDLNLVIDASKFSAYPLTDAGFAFMWSGARATHGFLKGKVCFEVMVTKHLDVSHLPSDEPNPHVVRVGFSVEDSTMQLGEDPLSYGYGGSGKISTNCQFRDYGTPFAEGDCITALLNMDSDPVEIGFAKNGRFAGWAYKVNKSQLQNKALFAHVLTKNTSFEVNFGLKEKPHFPLPDGFQDYTFIGSMPADTRLRGTPAPERREDCEMIMMCGLPGAGKSAWAADFALKTPEKKYNVLGTNNIIDKMKVMGLPRKRNYHGRWDILIQMATKCLNKLFEIGSKLRRNYILDQTNVYPTAQRRKMRNFEGFQRKSVVVVPEDAEYKRRCDKRDREEGKEIPDHAVLEMKANFKLPEVCDIFDDVIFTELKREEAEKLVRVYNEEGRAAVGPAGKRFRPNDQKDNSASGGHASSGNNASFSGGSRGSRNAGGFDRERDRRGRGGGGYNNPGPRNAWGEGPPQGGFGGGNGGRTNNRGGFGGPRGGFGGGFDGGNPSGGFRGRGGFGSPGNNGGRGGFGGPRGGFGGGASSGGFGNRSPGNFGDFSGGYGGSGSPGYGDHSPGGYGGGGGGFVPRGGPRGGFQRGGERGRPPIGYGGGYNEGNDSGFGGGYGNNNNNQAEGDGGYNDYRGNSGADSSGSGYGNDYGNEPAYGGGSTGSGRGSYGSSFRKDSFGGGRGMRGNFNSGGNRGGYGGNAGRGGTMSGNNSGPGGFNGGNNSPRGGRGGSSRGGGSSNRGYSAPPPPLQPRGAARGGGHMMHNWSDNQYAPPQSEIPSQVNQGGYGSYGSPVVKSEPAPTAYSGYEQNYGNYNTNTPPQQPPPPQQQATYQSYTYQPPPTQPPPQQQAAPAMAAPATQWDPSAAAAVASAAVAPAPVAVSQPTPEQIQQQWTQYYQQQSQQQYYSQYYGQVAAAAAAAATTTPVYGTGAYTTTTK